MWSCFIRSNWMAIFLLAYLAFRLLAWIWLCESSKICCFLSIHKESIVKAYHISIQTYYLHLICFLRKLGFMCMLSKFTSSIQALIPSFSLCLKFRVGPKGKQLEGTECPLHVVHPPTGEEFALGCGVCRNAHTF